MSIDYTQYMQSPEWKERREYMLRLWANKCALCSSPRQLNVHHNTYERLGREFDADLIVLCRDCHALFHDKLPPVPADDIGNRWWEGYAALIVPAGDESLYLTTLPRPFNPTDGGFSWYPAEDGRSTLVEWDTSLDKRLFSVFATDVFETWLTTYNLT